jgi:hypothetical protein
MVIFDFSKSKRIKLKNCVVSIFDYSKNKANRSLELDQENFVKNVPRESSLASKEKPISSN